MLTAHPNAGRSILTKNTSEFVSIEDIFGGSGAFKHYRKAFSWGRKISSLSIVIQEAVLRLENLFGV
jgi:hypothetical protein